METRVTVHTHSQTNRNLHLCQGLALLLVLESSKVPGHLLIMRHRKAFGAHVPENLHRDQVIAVCAPFERSSVFCLSTRIPGRSLVWSTWLSKFKKKKDHWIPKVSEENAALQIGSEEIELVTHRHDLHGSFDWFSQAHSACCFSHSTPSRSTSLMEAARLMPSDCSNFEDERQLHNVRWTSTMYWVHLDSGANQGEIPGIGESPSNQPISGLVIFSKRQALSRAVVVNSNISRGKYLAREGPGSRLRRFLTSFFLGYHGDLRVQIFLDQARRGGTRIFSAAPRFIPRWPWRALELLTRTGTASMAFAQPDRVQHCGAVHRWARCAPAFSFKKINRGKK